MIARLDSISGVIISMVASSVVNHDYKAGSISDVIIRVLTSSVGNHDYKILSSLAIMVYHTRGHYANNYTTDTVQPCNHDLPH
jgi:uncharacterized membrane protein YeaQ/YmgE (transglycosylase-associated protein family)